MTSRPTPSTIRLPVVQPVSGIVIQTPSPSTAMVPTQPSTVPGLPCPALETPDTASTTVDATRFSLSLCPVSTDLVPSRPVGSLALLREALPRKIYGGQFGIMGGTIGAATIAALALGIPFTPFFPILVGGILAIAAAGSIVGLPTRNQELRLILLVRNIFSFAHPVPDFDVSSTSPDIYRPDSPQRLYPEPNSPKYQALRRKFISIKPGDEKHHEVTRLLERKRWDEWEILATSFQEEVLALHPQDPALGVALRTLLTLSIEARFALRGNIWAASTLAENYFKAILFFDKDMPDHLRQAIQETIHQPALRWFYREVGVFSPFARDKT